MKKFDTKKYPIYASFLNQLAKDLTKFYYAKLDKPFKITNKMKGKGYDPVTTSDKAFEKFIRSKISKKFPNHQIIGEEYGHKNTKSEFSWVIDPIDGTRSYVVGNPSWSNLISLNYNGEPILGLANFPKMKKYYLNLNKNSAYVFENNKKRKLKINTKLNFTNAKLAAAFHHHLSLKQQLKIKKFKRDILEEKRKTLKFLNEQIRKNSRPGNLQPRETQIQRSVAGSDDCCSIG